MERTRGGRRIIRNFLYRVCGAKGDYTMDAYIENEVRRIREQAGEHEIVLGLSGGVDSAVAAALIERAVPDRLTCIFVDHGMMRKNERAEIEAAFGGKSLRLVCVDAKDRFLSRLAGVTEPEQKRKIIGEEFVRVFESESAKYEDCFLAQGTIYPDVIESGREQQREHQEPPQCGRTAEGEQIRRHNRAFARTLQGRGTRAGA